LEYITAAHTEAMRDAADDPRASGKNASNGGAGGGGGGAGSKNVFRDKVAEMGRVWRMLLATS
jgi:hypothetical protein